MENHNELLQKIHLLKLLRPFPVVRRRGAASNEENCILRFSFYYKVHPKLDLVNFAVGPLLFTKSCSSLNWICSKNEIGWNYSELKDINLKYILSKDSLRYININLPMFCNFQLLNIPIFQKNSKNHGKYPQNYPNIAKFQ